MLIGTRILEFFDNVNTNGLFRGIYAADQIPDFGPGNALFIANTEPSSTEGKHWIVMGELNGCKIFFDSYGRPPEAFNSYISSFASKYHYYCNRVVFQGLDSMVCGYYCMFLIARVAEGCAILDILIELMACGNSDNYVVEQVTEINHRTVENPVRNQSTAYRNTDKYIADQETEKHQKSVENRYTLVCLLVLCIVLYIVFNIQMAKGLLCDFAIYSNLLIFIIHTFSNLNYDMYEDEMMEVD